MIVLQAAWTIIGTIQAESAGWETHAFALPSYTGTIAEIRFTAESGGLVFRLLW